jgi:hypothetical protein
MRSDESENPSMKERLRCIELITQFDDDKVHTVASMLEHMAPATATPRKRGPRSRSVPTEKEVEA